MALMACAKIGRDMYTLSRGMIGVANSVSRLPALKFNITFGTKNPEDDIAIAVD